MNRILKYSVFSLLFLFAAGCEEESQSRKEKLANKIAEIEEAKEMAAEILEEKRAFAEAKKTIGEFRGEIKSGKIKIGSEEIMAAILDHETEETLLWAETGLIPGKNKAVEDSSFVIRMVSENFKECSGVKAKVKMDDIEITDVKCAKLFEKHGIK